MPVDKMLHLVVGYLIVFLLGFFHLTAAIVLMFAAAIGKELFDHYTGKGTPEMWDTIWTVIGGMIGLQLHLYLKL